MVSSLEASSQLVEATVVAGLAQGSPASPEPAFGILFAAQQDVALPAEAVTEAPSLAVAQVPEVPNLLVEPAAQGAISGTAPLAQPLTPAGTALAHLVASLSFSMPQSLAAVPQSLAAVPQSLAAVQQPSDQGAVGVPSAPPTRGALGDLTPISPGGEGWLSGPVLVIASPASPLASPPASSLASPLASPLAIPLRGLASESIRLPTSVGASPLPDLGALIAQVLSSGSLAAPERSAADLKLVEPSAGKLGSISDEDLTHAAAEIGPDLAQIPPAAVPGVPVVLTFTATATGGISATSDSATLNPHILAQVAPGPVRRTPSTIPGSAYQGLPVTARPDQPRDISAASEEFPQTAAHAQLPADSPTEVIATPRDREPAPSDQQPALPSLAPGAWQPPVPVPVPVSGGLRPAAPSIPAISEPRRLAQLAGSDSSPTSGSVPVTHPAELPAGTLQAQPLAAPLVSPPPSQVLAPLPNPVERIVAHQVVRAVARHPEGGDRSLVIRLTPPELGTVRVEIMERDGQLTARLHADDPAVRQALDRLLPQMRSDLRLSDAPLQQITVASGTAADQGFDGRGFDGRGAQAHPDTGRQSGRQRRGDRPAFSLDGEVAVTAPAALPSRARTGSGVVDALA